MKNNRHLLLLCLILSVCFWGCGRSSKGSVSSETLSKMIGNTVRVQFRRDMLGAASPIPISPMTGEINGASTTLVGTLTKVECDAIVVEVDGRLHWVPQEVVLLIQAKP